MNGFRYLKMYSFINVIIIMIFSILYIYTLKSFLILFVISFSLILLMYIFIYYNAKKGRIHFIRLDKWVKYNKITYAIYIIILTLSLFTVFEITNREVIRISSIVAAIILLSVLSLKYNKKYTKGIKV